MRLQKPEKGNANERIQKRNRNIYFYNTHLFFNFASAGI